MPRFYFDVFDGSKAVIDEYGDNFIDLESAAGQAVDIIAGYARDLMPGDGSRDFGVAVRGGAEGSLYRAALMFRDDCSGPSGPGASQDPRPLPPTSDPMDPIRQAHEARRKASETRQLLHDIRLRTAATRSRSAETTRQLEGEWAETRPLLSGRRRAA